MEQQRKLQTISFETDKVVRRDDAFKAYINSTQFGFTKWDVQMICGIVTISKDPTHNYAEELGVITMSPTHAKAVLGILEANLKAYERDHGPIIMPTEQTALAPPNEEPAKD